MKPCFSIVGGCAAPNDCPVKWVPLTNLACCCYLMPAVTLLQALQDASHHLFSKVLTNTRSPFPLELCCANGLTAWEASQCWSSFFGFNTFLPFMKMQLTVHSGSFFVFLLLTCIQFTCCFTLPNYMLWYFIAPEVSLSIWDIVSKWMGFSYRIFIKKYMKCCGDVSAGSHLLVWLLKASDLNPCNTGLAIKIIVLLLGSSWGLDLAECKRNKCLCSCTDHAISRSTATS